MRKKVLWAVLIAGALCVSCGRTHKDVSNGDKVVISDALVGKEKADAETEETASPSDNPDETDKKTVAESTPQGQSASASPQPTATYVPIVSHDKVKLYDSTGTAVIGDTGYEIYNYVPGVADTYAKLINRAGKEWGDSCKIYDLIVPTSAGVTLPDNKADKTGTSDQKKSIHKMYHKIKNSVTTVDLYDALMKHRTEYIYYRTDHHWTALGAYYAYQTFCKESGRTPHELSEYRKKSFGSFMGTFYSDTNQNRSLRKDKVKAYYPVGKHISMKIQTDSGKMVRGQVIEDASNYGVGAKYYAFLGGDNAYSVITNKDVHDDSACIVVKESFGNAWTPYLADHYHKVYVVDYRYWTGKLSKLIKEKKVQDIIFINNISMTRNAYLVGKLSQVVR